MRVDKKRGHASEKKAALLFLTPLTSRYPFVFCARPSGAPAIESHSVTKVYLALLKPTRLVRELTGYQARLCVALLYR
jgi:hypothetical protein